MHMIGMNLKARSPDPAKVGPNADVAVNVDILNKENERSLELRCQAAGASKVLATQCIWLVEANKQPVRLTTVPPAVRA